MELTKEQIKERFLSRVLESYRVVKKDRTVLLCVKCEMFELMSIWGAVVVSFDHPETPFQQLSETVLNEGRFFFNRQANTDYCGLLAFHEGEVTPVGYTFDEMLDRVVYKLKTKKDFMVYGVENGKSQPVQPDSEKQGNA